MNDIEQSPYTTRGDSFVRPDVDDATFLDASDDAMTEWSEGPRWWPVVLMAVAVVAAVWWWLS